MIHFYPIDFLWPEGYQELRTIIYADYLISDIMEFIINDLQVGQSVYIYGDSNCSNQLESQYTMSQYGITSDKVLYVCINPKQQQNNLPTVKVTIDNENDMDFVISSETTINEFINQLIEQQIIKQQIGSIEFFDENGLALAIFYSLQLLNFTYVQSFQLKINTQAIIPEVIESQIDLQSSQQNQYYHQQNFQQEVKVKIDDYDIQQGYQVALDTSINDIISYLMGQGMIQQNIISVELLDPSLNILTNNQFATFLEFSHIQNFELKLYTQAIEIPQEIVNQIDPQNIQEDNYINIEIVIDSFPEQQILVSDIVTINGIIQYFIEQGIIEDDLVLAELLDHDGTLLTQDQSIQLISFPNFNNFKLLLYTQQPQN